MPFALLVGVLLCGVWLGSHVEAQIQGQFKLCPSGWTVFEGRCYLFNMKQKNWTDSELTCITSGGNLASLRDSSVTSFIQEVIYRSTGSHVTTWVGGLDAVSEGIWLWSDGSRFTFKNWGKGEPNNKWGDEHCMVINYKGKYTNDENCSTKNSFVCARDLH